MRDRLEEARRRGAELGEKARSAAQRDGAPATATATNPLAGGGAASGAFTTTQQPFAASPAAPQHPFAASPATSQNPFSAPPAAAPRPPSTQAPVRPLPGTADSGPDIALPLDDEADSPTQPAYASPPAWMPPPPSAALPEAPPPPALTACPQCLSAVTDSDMFCGVCGFRLK